MPNLVRLVGKLPIPKASRLAWQANLIDRSFRRELAQARQAKKPYDEIAKLENQHEFEMSMIYEEQDELYTNNLLRTARRLRVPIPRMFANGKKGEFWEEGRALGLWYLSDEGVAKLRRQFSRSLGGVTSGVLTTSLGSVGSSECWGQSSALSREFLRHDSELVNDTGLRGLLFGGGFAFRFR